jgi:hypothetical protein
MGTINDFIVGLTRVFVGIREIWLIGSRANGTERADSDWDLLAFADEVTYEGLSKLPEFQNPKIDLLIVRDDDEFREPWGNEPKRGHLSEWAWTRRSETEAEYRGAKWIEDEDGGRTVVTISRALLLWRGANT